MPPIRTLLLIAGALAAPCAASAQQTITVAPSTPPRGWLGLGWRLDPNFVIRAGQPRARPAGFPTVSRVDPGSPAAAARLRVGDAIVAVNGVDSREGPLFPRIEAGVRYVLRIRRGDEERELALTVAPPAASAAAAPGTGARAAAHLTATPGRP
ncbi:MAG: PDZ domain-containing protein [Longimicrobiaceae bacterium]